MSILGYLFFRFAQCACLFLVVLAILLPWLAPQIDVSIDYLWFKRFLGLAIMLSFIVAGVIHLFWPAEDRLAAETDTD